MATSLVDFQRRMAADVMRPLTADEDMQPILPDGRAMADEAAKYVKSNSRLTAMERLELYNRQYWYRVIAALQEDYPALGAVVGRKRFEALTIAYLAGNPSRSFTLRNLGSKMVDYLRAHPEAAGRRAALAIDVARVEWAYVQAFDGAELPVLSPEQIAGITAESTIGLQPHLQLLELQYPVDDLVIAVHKGRVHSEAASQAIHEVKRQKRREVPTMRRRKTYLAVHRWDLQVYYRHLGEGNSGAAEYAVLQALRVGSTLGSALEQGLSALPPNADAGAIVAEWFHHWAELGWLCGAVQS
jgi:hypothetical protein